MLFKIDPRIFHDYPGVLVGVVVAHNIDNTRKSEKLHGLLLTEQEKLAAHLKKETLVDHPHIAPWRAAYKHFGAKPKKYPSSIENLVKRALMGEQLRSINPLVDAYNVVSLRYLVPTGGEDLATINGDIQLTIAGENEKPALLLGEKEGRLPHAGEVFYKDNNGAICRRWNWKEADRTKLTEKTKDAFLVIEALPPVTREILEAAVNQLAAYIEEFCGGTASIAILNEHNPHVALQDNGAYTTLTAKEPVDVSIVPLSTGSVIEDHGSEEHQVRLNKVEKMREYGIEPWPPYAPINAHTKDIIDKFAEDGESQKYQVAGRILTLRKHGKTIFANLQDRTGVVQIYVKSDEIGKNAFNQFNHFVDSGDIIWCSGTAFKTKMGEITLKVKEYTLLSKCLHPLPDKFHGIHDVEIKYRQRYLDLIATKESRDRFKKRSAIIRHMRTFFDANGYIEVETPMLQPIPGGAAAKPFITHHNALDMELYLRIAPELYLKRLVVGGFERVYEINRNFRNEGISTKHNPEFTMVEFYTAHEDYHFAMDLVENMIQDIAKSVCGSAELEYGKYKLNFSAPFARKTMLDAVAEFLNCDSADIKGNIDMFVGKHNIKLTRPDVSWGEKLTLLFEELVESTLIQPTFITEFPIEVSPLSKRNPTNPSIADRFELFIAGVELSNGFNELNEPFDQAARFKEQAKARAAGEEEAHYYDADYIRALEYGLPPTVGVGIGIDRLVMFLTDAQSIRDVILFPTLKEKSH